MTKLDAVDLQNKELNDLYDFEYNRRFPESEDSIPTQFVRGLSRELSDPNSYANKGGSFADGLGEGFVQGATDGYLREADKHKHEGMGDIYDIIADIKLQTQKLKADALNDQADINQKNQAIKRLTPPVRQLSEAQYAGDTNAVHDIGRGIFEMMKSMGMVTGNYITTRDGTIIGEDENGVESININDLIAQSGKTPEEIFGDDADRIMSMLSKGSKAKYEQVQAMSQAELDEKYAKTDNLNAQAGKYDAEAGKIGYEMQNPPLSEMQKTINTENIKGNGAYLKKLSDTYHQKDYNVKLEILNRMQDLVDTTPHMGQGLWSALKRRYVKETGDSSKINSFEVMQKHFFSDIKGVAGNPNAAEWNDLVSRIIGPHMERETALEQIELEKDITNNKINEYNSWSNVLSNNPDHLSYHNPIIKQRVREEMDTLNSTNDGISQSNQNMVIAKDPESGEERMIPIEKIEEARSRGLLINE